MAMIHCVGSRQIPGIHEADEAGVLNEYCSRTCCTATIQAALQCEKAIRKHGCLNFIGISGPMAGARKSSIERASKNGVVFFRFEAEEPPMMSRSDRQQRLSPFRITVKDTLTFGEEMEVPVDLVVLAVGMEPNPVPDLVEMMKLPVGSDRFLLEVHPKLRPVELSMSGILLAGTCQAPMDIGEACSRPGAAAVKASGILARGYVELDPFVAEVDIHKCRGTGACLEACLNPGALTDGGNRSRGAEGPASPGEPGPLPGLRRLCGRLSGKCHSGQRVDPATIRGNGGYDPRR